MPQIVTIGEILVEIMAKEIGQTFLEPGLWEAPYPSGAPAIFISQAARFGASTGMVGCVGDDDFGQLNIKRLQEDGVDISAISISNNLPTGCAFVTYKNDGSRNFIYHIPNAACGQINPDLLDPKWLADCRYLHVMGSSFAIPGVFQTVEKAAQLVKQHGGKISFDPNIRPELIAHDKDMHNRIMSVYKQADILLPGLDELPILSGESDFEKSIDKVFAQSRAEIIALKNGSKGSMFLSRDERFEVPPFVVEEVDPTGAGDCFGGALIAALTLGFDSKSAMTLAAAAGALAVTRKGPMEGACFLNEARALAGL